MPIVDVLTLGQEVDAVRLLAYEMERESWKKESASYIELVEERFQAVADGLNACEDTDVAKWFCNTLENMPGFIVGMWNTWVVQTETTLPDVQANHPPIIIWLVAPEVGV